MPEVTNTTLAEVVSSCLSPESDQSVAQGLHDVRAGMELKVSAKAVANKTLPDDVAAFVKAAVSSHSNQEPAFSDTRCVNFCV